LTENNNNDKLLIIKKEVILIEGCHIDNKKLINAINLYFKVPNQKTMLNLIIFILQNKLYKTGNNTIKLAIDKISYSGGYKDNTIFISAKHLKTAKKTENFVSIIKTIYHEFGHFLIDLNNKKVIKNNGDYNRYFPEYIEKDVNPIYKKLFNDLEMEIYAHIIFYSSNKNEYFARKYAHKNICDFVDEYAKDKGFNIKSFDEEEKNLQLKNYNSIPELKYYKSIIIDSINIYQQKLITCGIEKISEEQRCNLINSFILTASKENKFLLLKAINSCENRVIKNDLLRNPIVCMIKNSLFKQEEQQSAKN